MFNPENTQHVYAEEVNATLLAIANTSNLLVSVGEQRMLDPTYIVPLHHSPDRFQTIQTTVRSIVAQQGRADKVAPTMVIADNGVAESDMRGVIHHAQAMGVDVRVADARPRNPSEKNAAYARNQALGYIAATREQDERMRGPIGLIDSDSAFVEDDAMMRLTDALEAYPNAQSVNGVVELVPDVEKAYMDKNQRGLGDSQRSGRALPSLWRPDGSADLAGIVAFSSQIAGKTTGQLMRPGSVGPDNAYVQMPNGSAEDMIAALYQSRKGGIYSLEHVHIIDQDRPNPEASLKQQMQWGEDHVYLQNALAQVGAQHPGIVVLEPTTHGWHEWIVSGSEEVSGVVVNPAQLRQLLSDIHSNSFSELPIREELFQLESTRLANVLTFIEERRTQSAGQIRTDLPYPKDATNKNGRFTDVAQLGRLIGNMSGVHMLNDCDNAFTIPQTFLYGMRQSAQW